jgi:predicted nucleic acid-binding protein
VSIVSNASPLINLARIGKLNLLRKLYGELVIPEAVWREVVVEGSGQPGADEIETADWIKTRQVTNRELVRALQQELDAGEAEAIALALEIGAELLLMDEHLGRETARHLGLRYVGLVGMVIEAKHKGLIDAVKPHLDALRIVAGFRVSDALYKRVLRDEKEIGSG